MMKILALYCSRVEEKACDSHHYHETTRHGLNHELLRSDSRRDLLTPTGY